MSHKVQSAGHKIKSPFLKLLLLLSKGQVDELPGGVRRAEQEVLTRETGGERWPVQLGGQQREPTRPVLTAAEPESACPWLCGARKALGAVRAGCQGPRCETTLVTALLAGAVAPTDCCFSCLPSLPGPKASCAGLPDLCFLCNNKKKMFLII